MTVGKLKAILEGLNDNTQVLLGTQPEYPFITTVHAAIDYHPNADDAWAHDPLYVVLLEGNQLGYADKELW